MKIHLSINIFLRIATATLLFICLMDMPYGYYGITRFVASFTFIVLGLSVTKSDYSQFIQIIYFSLAVLFQPIFKIALGRTIWNIIDIVVGVGLLISIFIIYRQKNARNN